MTYCPNESHILNTFFFNNTSLFFIDPWTWQIGQCTHRPISCHGFSAAAEDVLNWTLGLDIRGTTIRKATFWAGRSLLIHTHPCSRFIHSNRMLSLWCTKELCCIKLEIVICKHAKKFHAHVNSFSRAQKCVLCACKSLYFLLLFFLF